MCLIVCSQWQMVSIYKIDSVLYIFCYIYVWCMVKTGARNYFIFMKNTSYVWLNLYPFILSGLLIRSLSKRIFDFYIICMLFIHCQNVANRRYNREGDDAQMRVVTLAD